MGHRINAEILLLVFDLRVELLPETNFAPNSVCVSFNLWFVCWEPGRATLDQKINVSAQEIHSTEHVVYMPAGTAPMDMLAM